MGEIFVYILKSSLCLAIFYLFFKLMLCRETFHRFNRIVLLSLFLISLLIPFIRITFSHQTPYSDLALNLDYLLSMAEVVTENPEPAPKGNSIIVTLIIFYVAGAIVTSLFSAISFIRMFMLFSSGKRVKVSREYTLITHRNSVAPFSWMKYIVISENDYLENGKEIILHELAHIRKRHSIDLLIAEAVKIVHWFNPASWLLKQQLQSIHEYQADSAVLENGIDSRRYQLLLIKKAVGDRLYSIANSFNHSKLKNRITMITKKKSKRVAAFKALFILPVSFLAVVSFASAKVADSLAPVSEIKITDFLLNDTIKQEVIVLELPKATVIQETQNTSVNNPNTSVTLSYRYDIEKVKSREQNQISHSYKFIIRDTIIVGKGSAKVKKEVFTAKRDTAKVTGKFLILEEGVPNPLVIVNGKEDSLFLKSYDPTTIASITVLKDASAASLYGEKAKNGVIIIALKNGSKTVKDSIILKEHKADSTQVKYREKILKARNVLEMEPHPLYVIDGEISKNTDISSIPPEIIQSMTILKGADAVKKYGEKGKNGVIEIILKN